jgi:hypothetical protein
MGWTDASSTPLQCPACEAKSYLVHDPKHAFLRIDRPVDFQIRSRVPLIPLLYSAPAGQTVDPSLPLMRADVAERQAAVRNQSDPTGPSCLRAISDYSAGC